MVHLALVAERLRDGDTIDLHRVKLESKVDRRDGATIDLHGVKLESKVD